MRIPRRPRHIEVVRPGPGGRPETVLVRVDGPIQEIDGRMAMVDGDGATTFLDEAPAAQPGRFGRTPWIDGRYDVTSPEAKVDANYVDDLTVGSPFGGGAVRVVGSSNVTVGNGGSQVNTWGPDGTSVSETTHPDGTVFRTVRVPDGGGPDAGGPDAGGARSPRPLEMEVLPEADEPTPRREGRIGSDELAGLDGAEGADEPVVDGPDDIGIHLRGPL